MNRIKMIEDKVSKNEQRLCEIQKKLDSYEIVQLEKLHQSDGSVPYAMEKKSCQEV